MRHRSWHKLLFSSSLLAFLVATLAGCANLSQPRYWGDCAIGGGVSEPSLVAVPLRALPSHRVRVMASRWVPVWALPRVARCWAL